MYQVWRIEFQSPLCVWLAGWCWPRCSLSIKREIWMKYELRHFPRNKGAFFPLVPRKLYIKWLMNQGLCLDGSGFNLKTKGFEVRQIWIWSLEPQPLSSSLLCYTREGVVNKIHFSGLTHMDATELEWGTVKMYAVIEQIEWWLAFRNVCFYFICCHFKCLIICLMITYTFPSGILRHEIEGLESYIRRICVDVSLCEIPYQTDAHLI